MMNCYTYDLRITAGCSSAAMLPVSCLFILHLPLSQLAAASIDTTICNIESHSVQLTSAPSAHSHANAAVRQLTLWVRYHSLLCPARPTSLLFSSGCLYFLFIVSCRCSEKAKMGGAVAQQGCLLRAVTYLAPMLNKSPQGPSGYGPWHRGLNEIDWD